ncbi:hypothetical protein CS8_089010 [Cupriavidus sp. 8B]
MISEQFRTMLRGVAELTTTQFEELQAAMERVRGQGTCYPSIGMGQALAKCHDVRSHGGPQAILSPDMGKSSVVNGWTAPPRSRQTSEIAIPARLHAGYQTETKPAAMVGFSFEAASDEMDLSPPAPANCARKVNAPAAGVKIEIDDDGTVFAETPAAASARDGDDVPDPGALTKRQRAVLTPLLEGLPNKLIARRLGLTENTVKEHVAGILRRLGLRSRAEVISRMGLRMEASRAGDSLPLTAAAAAGEQDGAIESTQRAPITPEALGLTQRQGSVLILLLEGLPNKIIALRLGLTENTVKEHVSGILQRLGLRTRTEAMSRMKRYHVRHLATVGTPSAGPAAVDPPTNVSRGSLSTRAAHGYFVDAKLGAPNLCG